MKFGTRSQTNYYVALEQYTVEVLKNRLDNTYVNRCVIYYSFYKTN